MRGVTSCLNAGVPALPGLIAPSARTTDNQILGLVMAMAVATPASIVEFRLPFDCTAHNLTGVLADHSSP